MWHRDALGAHVKQSHVVRRKHALVGCACKYIAEFQKERSERTHSHAAAPA
jgi:hypothetical protein